MLQRIGRYEILGQIGRGGQGTVYRARDTGLDRVVAVKVINQSIADDPAYLEALQREARLAAGLDHPHITTVYDFQVEDGLRTSSWSTCQTLWIDTFRTVAVSPGSVPRRWRYR